MVWTYRSEVFSTRNFGRGRCGFSSVFGKSHVVHPWRSREAYRAYPRNGLIRQDVVNSEVAGISGASTLLRVLPVALFSLS